MPVMGLGRPAHCLGLRGTGRMKKFLPYLLAVGLGVAAGYFLAPNVKAVVGLA